MMGRNWFVGARYSQGVKVIVYPLIVAVLALAALSEAQLTLLVLLLVLITVCGFFIVELVGANKKIKTLNADLERRVAERTEELRNAQVQLVRQERLAVLGQLTATVSHELRNPLGLIRTAVFLVANKTREKGLGVERALERAERGIVRCDNIIAELLDFTRSNDLAVESTSIDDWLNQVIDEQSVPEGVTVRKKLGVPGLEVGFDQERFRRAVINVFENGCQALAETLKRDRGERDAIITVESRAEENRAELSFTDTGPGMDPKTKEKIFEPLFSTKAFGVGLGLPTVRQVMEQHGGGVELDSEPGRGTSVVLWLPLARHEARAA